MPFRYRIQFTFKFLSKNLHHLSPEKKEHMCIACYPLIEKLSSRIQNYIFNINLIQVYLKVVSFANTRLNEFRVTPPIPLGPMRPSGSFEMDLLDYPKSIINSKIKSFPEG